MRPFAGPGKAPAGYEAVGRTGKPVDNHAPWGGDRVTRTWPEGFAPRGGGGTGPAVPLAKDPGDWTVVSCHLEDDPTKCTGMARAGFRVA
ncbi:hypothetical protein AB0D94_34160 [Streptomyces sp. NPDC048255]|uniref:hypothetical protein n=1 Tax=Streptomyces TaxID=1883 RepID=UPI0033D8E77C